MEKSASTDSKNRAALSVAQSAVMNSRMIEIRSSIYNALMIRIDPNAAINMSSSELRQEVEEFVTNFVGSQGMQLNRREQLQIAGDIVNDMIGFGPLEVLLTDDKITDIMVNGPDQIYVERKGKLEKTWVTFRDFGHVLQIAQRIANRVGRRVDESSPMVDARLPDGSRVNIIISPVSLNGPVISIRKFSKRVIDINMMVRQKNLSDELAEFLDIATKCRLNVIVSGGTGSGKTTLLNAISQMIDPGERIVTIEDAAELRLQQPHVVRLETRPKNIEGEGEIPIRDLVKNALRMRPDRIDMLQAMNTGHDGSMSTIHANKAIEALLRLENMITMSEAGIPSKVIRAQISGGVDLIVGISRMRDGVRRINEILEVMEMNGEEIETQTLFSFDYVGEDEDGILKGEFKPRSVTPMFLEKARYFGLDQKLLKLLGAGGC
jgi:pilus assembly protein CpaF